MTPSRSPLIAVLDTSVLVAGLRSKRGASFQLLQAVRHGDLRIVISVAMAMEYEAVATREGLVPGFDREEIRKIVDGLCRLTRQQRVFYLWRPFLPDPDDDMILELAVAAGVKHIVTHNIGDFAGCEALGPKAITPAEALEQLRKS
jgi:putative PIN family toxin of toxin-antitoxin system